MSPRSPISALRRLLSELGRRRVVHAVAVYAVVAWIAVQVAAIAFPALFIPRQALTVLVFAAALGFPVTVALAWAFEITDDGIRRTPTVADDGALSPAMRVVFAAAVLLGTAGIGWLGWETWLSPRAGSLPARAQGPVSPAADSAADDASPRLSPSRVAVLYFDDHSRGDTLTAFADGLTENLIHRLAQVEGLEVVSRHGVKPYRGSSATLDSIARDLGAGSLVEGSVEPAGDGRLEVTVQLIDGRTRAHLMSEVIRRPDGDVFALQDTVAQEVSRLLRARLGPQVQLAAWQSRAHDPEAWRRVQEADRLREDAHRLKSTGEDETARRLLAQADSLLASASRLDPAWNGPETVRARLALVRADPYSPGWTGEEREAVRRALEYADRAVEEAPDDAEALAVRGRLRFYLSRHVEDRERSRELLDAAEADLRRATRQDPSAAEAWYGLSELLHLGRGELSEAQYAAERALESDAYLDFPADVQFQFFYTAANEPNYEAAAHWCRTGQRQHPGNVNFRACELTLLATDGAGPPDVERAWQLVAEIAERARPDRHAYFRAVAHRQVAAVLARAGAPDSARAVLRRARRGSPTLDDEPILAYDEAHTRLLLGEEDRALELLRRFLEAHPEYAPQLPSDPWFSSLRERPRFRKLVGL